MSEPRRVHRDAVKLAQTPTEGVCVQEWRGKTLVVNTKNSRYTIQIDEAGNAVYWRVDLGSPDLTFSEPIPIFIHGSTWGGSMMKLHYIGIGMHMEFDNGEKTYTTSAIQSILIKE